MRNRFRTRLAGLAPLRAALALVFFILTSLQPGMFAVANAKGLHGGTELAGEMKAAGPKAHGKHAQHHHSGVEEAEDEGSAHHHGERFAGKACEVHCAPATAVPVECPDLQGPVGRCFEPVLASVLIDGEYAEFIRPPRRLI